MRVEHVSVAEGYLRWAADYDSYENPLIAVEEPVVHRVLGDVRGKNVLDAACGTGRHSAWLAAAGASVVGIDESEAMLAIAREKYPELELVHGSVLDLYACFPNRKFELVLNALMAEHVADLSALFASLVSVLAPGGSLVFSVWHPAMIEKGVPTHYEDEASGVEYVLPTFGHRAEHYLAAVRALGLALSEVVEPTADAELVRAMPHMEKHAGMPLALVLRAELPR